MDKIIAYIFMGLVLGTSCIAMGFGPGLAAMVTVFWPFAFPFVGLIRIYEIIEKMIHK